MLQSGARMRRRITAALASVGVFLLGGALTPASAASLDVRSQEWYLDAMKAAQMWQTSTGRGVTVAVIDTGVRANHPDLAGQVLPGRDFSKLGGGATADADGHGTGMAGVIAGTGKGLGGKGAVGLAPGAKILPIRIGAITGNEASNLSEFLKELPAAIRFAADSDAKIINISQGSTRTSPELQQAVDYARSKGKLVVAATGNEAEQGNLVEYPAALSGVVGVGAVDRNGQVAAFSERGPQVDLAAPGVDIARPCVSASGYCKGQGTSDSAALVSASAALVWAQHPSWTANQVLRVLVNTAGKDGSGHSDFLGYGVVRPRVALTTPGDPGPAGVDPLAASDKSAAPGSSAPAASPSTADASQAPGDAATPSSSAAPTPAPAASSDDGGSGAGMWIGIGAAVLVVAAIVVVVLVRRGRGGGGGGGGSNPPSGGFGGGQYSGQHGGQYGAPQPPYQAPPPGGSFGPPQ
ncbi:type VII secretion-associated serine protease mycosin [Peterkaempfera sp. SMS 1(5)a]|uniref:type VII secretion-associated serine protease mycosin n=1 Tax=Peterkaempfera podocarpi TaxID=3232308 RepID=UPI0036700F6D